MGWNELKPPPAREHQHARTVKLLILKKTKAGYPTRAVLSFNCAAAAALEIKPDVRLDVEVGTNEDAYKIRLTVNPSGNFRLEKAIRNSLRLSLGALPGLLSTAKSQQCDGWRLVRAGGNAPAAIEIDLPKMAFDAAVIARPVGARDVTAAIQGDPAPDRAAAKPPNKFMPAA